MARIHMPGAESPTTRRLPWMIAGDTLSGIFGMLTVFGSAFVLFLDALGLDNTRIGVLLALVPFCGIISIFIAPLVSRWGFRRTALIFWGARHFFMALVLFTPVILRLFGLELAYLWAAVLILIFGLFRATAETAFYPWVQEVVPNSIRGKFSAITGVISTLAQMITVALASLYIEGGTGTGRYMVLIGVGSVIGASSVLCYARVPGGAPMPEGGNLSAHLRSMGVVLRDRGYMLFLAALSLLTLVISTFSFVPLFMTEQVGMSSGNAMMLSVAASGGSILSSYLWGWSADRYGSRPVMRWVIAVLLLSPITWLLMPRHSPISMTLAFGVAFVQGVGNIGWTLASQRYLFVHSATSERRVAYLTCYYVWSQIANGLGPILVGSLLDATQGLTGRIVGVQLDPYAPMFMGAIVLMLLGLLAVTRLRGDTVARESVACAPQAELGKQDDRGV